MDYYLILDGTVYGPYTLSEMKSLQLFPDTPVHLSSWPDDKWVYASDLAELRDYTPDLHAARSSSSSVTNIIHIVQPQSQPQPQLQPQPQPDITFPENNDEPCVEREPEKSYNTVIFPVIFLVIAAVAVIIAVGVGNSGSSGYDAGDVKSKDSSAYRESGTRPVVTNVPGQNGNKYNAVPGQNGNKYSAKASSSQHHNNEKTVNYSDNQKKSAASASYSNNGSSILVGTKWTKTEFGQKCTLEFISKDKVRVTDQSVHYWISEDELKPQVSIFKYYYDSDSNRFIVTNYPLIVKRLLYETGRLIETGSFANVEYERLR